MNAKEEDYSRARLTRLLKKHGARIAASHRRRALRRPGRVSRDTPITDDQTVVVGPRCAHDMPFAYQDRALSMDGVELWREIAAAAGTPCYVYSAAAILENFRAYDEAFGDAPHTVCYAVKANGNLALLRLLAQAGAGFDIVSGGELYPRAESRRRSCARSCFRASAKPARRSTRR